MKLLERYIFKGAAQAFVATLAGLTGVIWITQALRDFDLLTTKGQSVIIFFCITGLTIPSLIMLIAPIALFIALIYTLNKLNGDSELIVMCAAGSAPALLLRPLVVLTLLVLILDGYMSIVAMPWSFATLRNLLTQVRADFITRVVRPGQFSILEQGFVFHYRERGPNGELLGIFMQDRREPDKVMTYVAEAGQTVEKDGQDYLALKRGNVQRQASDSRDASIIVFDSYAIDLAQFGSEGDNAPLKPRERTTAQLIWADKKDTYVQQNAARFRAELHDRFINPLYALVAVVIAFAGLGEARTTRQGRGVATGLAALAFGVIRVAGISTSTFEVRLQNAVLVAYIIPCVTVVAALIVIFGLPLPRLPFRRSRGRPPRPAEALS